jgi:ribosomal protein S18 acetylase RimI-like enzyme
MNADELYVRNLREDDYPYIISVVDEWWDGRHMADMIPKLFFQHFQDTSFVAVRTNRGDDIVAFIVGFLSQTHPTEAYVHFVGVHPDYRMHGLGRDLYERFFETARSRGCRLVRCVTSPPNKGSIAFHRRMGFEFDEGDSVTEEGIPIHSNYDGRGQNRVCFKKSLLD